MQAPHKTKLQWHPPFYRSLQIELESDLNYLNFKEEYPVKKLPGRMDLLITKKSDYQVDKSIGRIFSKYNFVEYKPQGDTMGIDDYFYMYGNACLMKSSGCSQDAIQKSDITITFVSYSYPRELIKYLQKKCNKVICKAYEGIYYVKGCDFAIQLVILRELDSGEYLWLSSLHKGLGFQQQERLIQEYQSNRENHIYEEVMSFIAMINKDEFRRYEDMCKGLMEVVRPEIEQEKEEAIRKAEPKIIQETCLNVAKSLKDCLDVETIAQKLELPVEIVRKL